MACLLKNIGNIFRCQSILTTKQIQRHQPTRLLSTKLANIISEENITATEDPLSVEDYFQVGRLFTISDLFNARVHYGHKLGSLNEYMKPYIFGERLGHLIIDLDITARLLKQALNFTAHIAYKDGLILFVSQTPQHSFLIENTAKECNQFAHTRFWVPGMFTNSTVKYGAMTRLPDLCIVLNTLSTVLDQHQAVIEAAKMAIPVVGIVDTNCDPRLVTYPIPGNDDSPSSMELYCKLFSTVIRKSAKLREQNIIKGEE